MSRPVHCIDTSARDYTVLSKEPFVVQFRMPPKEMAHLRKPHALICGKSGNNNFTITGVKIIPGPPVDGMLLVQVTAERIT